MLVDKLFLQHHLDRNDDLSHDDQEITCRAEGGLQLYFESNLKHFVFMYGF